MINYGTNELQLEGLLGRFSEFGSETSEFG